MNDVKYFVRYIQNISYKIETLWKFYIAVFYPFVYQIKNLFIKNLLGDVVGIRCAVAFTNAKQHN